MGLVKYCSRRTPLAHSASMFEVLVPSGPVPLLWKDTSFQPRSSARMNRMCGLAVALSAAANTGEPSTSSAAHQQSTARRMRDTCE